MTNCAPKLDQVINHQFALQHAAEDLFLRRAQGNLNAFLYSTPVFSGDKVYGAQLWTQFLQTSTSYRVPIEETNLIAQAMPLLKKLGHGIEDFIDFGPGSAEAFNAKTRPLLNYLGIQSYRPLDICSDFLDDIGIIMRHMHSSVEIKPENCDFLNDEIESNIKPSWVYWGGLGFTNIPTTYPAIIPVDGIAMRLNRMRDLLQGGGHAILTLDSTNDQASLMRAYYHPIVVQHVTNLMYQIQRDCPEIRLSPSGWTYRPVWHPDQYMIAHDIVALRPQRIDLPNDTIYVKAGESFTVDHSFKLPPAFVSEIAKSVGWKSDLTFGDDGNVQLLILST